MIKGKFILVLGGARSGKSRLAEEMAARLGGKVVYIATAAVLDGEMAGRVQKHRLRRPEQWETVEETRAVTGLISRRAEAGMVFLLDCITIWLTNLLIEQNSLKSSISGMEKEAVILKEVERLALLAGETPAHVIAVSNEVGLGLVPEYPLGREFRDLAGRANQILARYADEVYLAVAGLPLRIKPYGEES
ncbi:MAG: bifunctional adenosylcobinamide kinase/adenosylcobinamide-phosphate guanylyltransferase [Peptococcaceae bacterium]|nr:MAG: bifunctional adenosylcobinamide kinase/adenosylcobinamide-phosphate guanylyltransferase [Peptococcaceae bacterium]